MIKFIAATVLAFIVYSIIAHVLPVSTTVAFRIVALGTWGGFTYAFIGGVAVWAWLNKALA